MILTKCGYYGHDKMDGSDDREKGWKEQREEKGFDSSELWSLGDTIVKFSLPRIKELVEIEKRTNAEWEEIEKDYEILIEGLELFIRNNGDRIWTPEEEKKVENALEEFGPMLHIMWF